MYWSSLTVRTEIGSVVPGTIARFVVTPAVSVNRKANASVNEHWNVPYSSAAKIKSKVIWSVTGTKSNSNIEALLVSPAFNPGIAASRSASPTHAYVPSLITPLSGPGAFAISPEVIINPLSNGHDDPLASKYPIPLVLP